MDPREFLRQMEDLKEFGRAKGNRLTKEEIADYCSDLGLTEEQLNLVYAYLDEHRVYVPGFSHRREKSAGQAEKTASKDSKYLSIYRRELRELPEYEKEEMEELYDRLRQGDETVIERAINAHLRRVLTLAGKYRDRGVPLEDLIQGGNLELVRCIRMLCGNQDVPDYRKAIDHRVRSCLIELVDEEMQNGDRENAILARTNLLLEATRTLAEEYGRIATMEELAEFTRMDVEEIRMYVELSRDRIEIGGGESAHLDGE